MNKADARLVLKRTFQAPVEQVYRAWTMPAMIKRWFAPGDMTVPEAQADVRVGGSYRITMQEPDGERYTTYGTYQQVVPNERLVQTWQWEGSQEQTLLTIEFRALGERTTELTLIHERFGAVETKEQHERGWQGCLQKLEIALATKL